MGHRIILTTAPESENLALADLRRVLTDPGAGGRKAGGLAEDRPTAERFHLTTERPAPGVLLVTVPESFEELAARHHKRPPIFIRHLQPVQREVPLVGDLTDLERLEEAALELAPGLVVERSFSVQTRLSELLTPHPSSPPPYGRFEVNERLSGALQAAMGAPLDVRSPEQVLSVLVTSNAGYLGLSKAQENLSGWAGGAIRFAREPGQVSRSEFKLLEALAVFHLSLPRSGAALDLGASPGGWTRLLRHAGLVVTAVDPGNLDPRVAADPGVHHVRATAQDYRCRHGEFAVIVNDMRMDARDSARLMLDYAPCLAPNGFVVMTLKLPHRLPDQVARQALGLLLRRYEVLGARQLFHNRSEITVALKRRLADGGAEESPGREEDPGDQQHDAT